MMWEEHLREVDKGKSQLIDFPVSFHEIPCQKCGVNFGNHSSSSEIFGNKSDVCGGFVEDEFEDDVLELRKRNDIT